MGSGIGKSTFIFFLSIISFAPALAEAGDLQLPPAPAKVKPAPEKTLGKNEGGVGLEAGETVPEFTTHTFDGKPIAFSELLQQAPLLVVFYRGGWCPYCNFQVRELSQAYPEFKKRGVMPVLISVDETDGSTLVKESYHIPFPVLSDPDLAAHEAFEVILRVSHDTYKTYKANGLDLEEWSGRKHHRIAVPGVFLVDKSGVVQWAHTSKRYKIRPRVTQLLDMLDQRAAN